MRVEHVDDLREVGERPCQPVDLVDDDDLDLAQALMSPKPLKCRSLHRAARKPSVVIQVWKRGPPGMLLAQDEGRTGLPLRPRGMSHWSLLCLR